MVKKTDFKNKKITIMGLGLHGGGLASARFFLEAGARLTITDLRDETTLLPSLRALEGHSFRTVLGEHREEDFLEADLVIKNPGVPASSPFLKKATRIESDISIFCSMVSNPILAITGTKGKSTTTSLLAHILRKHDPKTRLGGNITVSPLSFLGELDPQAPVVLELSSWQLADLRNKKHFHPQFAAITNILHDHQNSYKNFQDYVEDKKVIFKNQGPSDHFLVCGQGGYYDEFAREAPGLLHHLDDYPNLLPKTLPLPGPHNRTNFAIAAALSLEYGVESSVITEACQDFPGVPHRMEHIGSRGGHSFINDTAATIPDATAMGLLSFEEPVHLICGGTDKEIEMKPLENHKHPPASIALLDGNAVPKFIQLFETNGWKYGGPFTTLKEAFLWSLSQGEGIHLLSPGAASFGMFLNEFDRGNQFRDLAKSWLEGGL